MTDLVDVLIRQGGAWGILVTVLLLTLWHRERELTRVRAALEREHRERLQDARENTRALLDAADQTYRAIRTLRGS